MSGDWSDSLFKPEKGDSLGDGSWGRPDDEPDLAPVAWDKLPQLSNKDRVRARLATPAPGSQKESGLLDIKTLAPDLVKGMQDKESKPPARKGTPAPSAGTGGGARLATAAKGSTGSGLIDVQELVRAQEEQEAQQEEAKEAALEAMSSSAAASMSSNSLSSSGLSSSLVEPIAPAASQPDLEEVPVPKDNRGPLMIVMALLAVVVAGLAVYVLSQ